MSLRAAFSCAALSLTALLLACSSASDPATGNNAGASGSGTSQAAGTGGSDATSAAGSATASPGGSASAGSNTAGSATGGGGSSLTAGTGGQDASAVDAARPSAGCSKPSTIEPGKFNAATIGGRPTWLHLPPTYDPERAYPLIFVWKGCSAAGLTSYGLENVVGEDAIVVQGDFPPGAQCYDTADNSTFPDLPFFDTLLAHVEDNYCVDSAHVFSVGFSSGAWLTQLLACQRGDVLRGIGTIAGAFKPAFLSGAAACKGNGLSAFMVSDLADHTNPFYDEDKDGDSVEVAVNHWLNANGCTDKTWSLEAGTPAAPDEAVCRSYAGCGRFPVELCLTDGKGHAAQETLSLPGFWQMFQQSLPK